MNFSDLTQLEQHLRDTPRPDALNALSERLVFGEGDPDARFMIIGEAPGADEDEQERPFVGRSGQLLDRILASVNLHRDDIYISNIVKYRPPGNRNPSQPEIAASEGILLEQIKIIRPQIIATLGNVPSQYFLKSKEGISKTHGQFFEWQAGIRIYPLYHPAYLLRNPSREQGSPKWQMWQDMKKLKAELDALPAKSGKVVLDTAQQEGLF